MQFTFKRDDEGRETMHVSGVCVCEWHDDGMGRVMNAKQHVAGVEHKHIADAIERADEAGFWDYAERIQSAREQIDAGHYTAEEIFGVGGWSNVRDKNEVTVDVPIAETTATLTLVSEGDDS